MTTNTSTARPKEPLSPLRIVSSVLFFLFGILSTISAVLSVDLYLRNVDVWPKIAVGYPETQINVVEAFFLLVSSMAAPLVGLAIVLFSLVLRKRWLPSIMGFALLIFVFLVPLIFDLAKYGNIVSLIPPVEDPIFGGYVEKPLGLLNVIVLAIAVVASIIASVLSTKSARKMIQPDLTETPQGAEPAQMPATQTSTQSNLANLPMFALIGAFVIPLAGIILGHLSLNYMKKGQLSDQNKGMAKTGLILGYVFVGLPFIVGLVIAVALVVTSTNRGY